MKIIVLTRGDLTNKLGIDYKSDNPHSDVRLNGQESAEAIVSFERWRRAERKDVIKL